MGKSKDAVIAPPRMDVDRNTRERRGNGPLCSLCKSPMVNNGVRRTNHPFVVQVHYKCSNDKCKNTSTVEERRR